MSTQLANILAILLIVAFLILMFVTTSDKNHLFIKYILLAFPLLRLDCVPGIYKLAVFDCLSILFFFFFYKRKRPLFRWNNLYGIFFLLVMSASIIGCVNAESLSEGTGQDFIRLFSIFMFAKVLVDECDEDPRFIHSIVSWIKISLVGSLVFLVAQFHFGIGFALEKDINKNILAEGATRYSSYLSDPQKFAQFLAAVSFLLFIKKDQRLPFINYGLFLLSIIAMLFTGARAALGGWCVGLTAVILLAKSKYKLVSISFAMVMFVVANNLEGNFATFEREQSVTESYEFRSVIWHDAYAIFLDNPFTGIGLGNYRNYVSVHNPDQFWVTEKGISYYDQPESGYLKLLTELGILGFVPAMLLILMPAFNAIVSFLKNREMSLVFLVASLITWLIGFYTVYSFGDVRIMVLIVTIICLLIAGSKKGYNYDLG